MISTIRSQLKQSTYRYVVFFMVSVIALSMVSSLFIKNERAGVSWAVRVNGVEIPYKNFAQEVAKQAQYLAQIKAQYGQYADLLFQSMGWSFDPKVRALDILVREELINQYANKMGIKLHPEYIAKVLNNSQFVKQHLGHIIPPFVFDQSGVLDMNILNHFLRQNGITAQQFEENIERALLQYYALNIIMNGSYIPTFDVKQEFIAKHLNKQFSYLTFSLDHYITEEKKKSVTEEELQDFYNAQNTQLRRYWVPEKRKGALWRFEPAKYNLVISDEEIQRYYEDNKVKNYVLDPLKVEVEQIFIDQVAQATNKTTQEVEKALLEKSTEFEKYWKPLKPFSRGQYKGEFESNAFMLQKEGEMSPVFSSKDGLTVLRLIKRIPRTYKPLVNVHEEIKNILINKAFKKEFLKDIKSIILQDDSKAIEQFISAKAGIKEVLADKEKEDTQLSEQLFSLKKNDYGFFVENGVGIVVLLTDIIERHLPDFSSIKDIVKGDYYEHKAKISLQNDLAVAKKDAETKTFEDIKNIFNLTIHNTGFVGPQDQKALRELNKKGLPAHEMFAMEKENSLISHESDNNSFLIKLEKIENFDENKFLSLENDVKNHLGSMRVRLLLEGAVASLHRNATIETSESLFITNEDYSE